MRTIIDRQMFQDLLRGKVVTSPDGHEIILADIGVLAMREDMHDAVAELCSAFKEVDGD